LSRPAQQNDPRTRLPTPEGRGQPRVPRSRNASPHPPRQKGGGTAREGTYQNTGAGCAKDYEILPRPAAPGDRAPRLGRVERSITKRLSATDISALASMKNVAKCDTWCELQNPVNHRVFERKLRPKPSGRGHVCLGVTHRVAPSPAFDRRRAERGADYGPPCAPACGRPKHGARGRECRDVWWLIFEHRVAPERPRIARRTLRRGSGLPLRPQVRRDYPLSLSISISGGKETYKDSPSSGERTGKSPALESVGPAVRIVVWRSVLRGGPGPSPLEGGAGEGESPVVPGPCRSTRRCRRVGLFGNAALSGR
jgi:hypothetical protein